MLSQAKKWEFQTIFSRPRKDLKQVTCETRIDYVYNVAFELVVKNARLPNFQACLKSYILPRIEWWWLFQFFLALIRAHFFRVREKRSSESRNYKLFRVYFAIQSQFNHRHQLFIHDTKTDREGRNFSHSRKKVE